MRLIELKLKNFRCYKEEVRFRIDDLTCIIGKNDIGKSTLLEGLNAFFNEVIDKGDLSSNVNSDTVEISCVFIDLPKSFVLDSSVETSPNEEHILNSDGNLEIKKTYKFGKTLSKATFLICEHPTDDRLKKILNLKNGPLKALAEEVGANLEGVNRAKNPPLRKAIRDAVGGETAKMELKVDGGIASDDNIKALWSQLKKLLPIFSLFKVDKEIDDKDKDVQDPMNQAIKESLLVPEIQELLKKVEDEVKLRSTEVADRTLEKLKAIDESLAEKMKSDFGKSPAWNKVFDLTLLNDQDIPLNKRGSGVKRLVLLSFFQAQAEKKKADGNSPSIIYAIEEPETSQHPNHQKILIDSFKELSEQESIQVIFTTHSSNLAKEIPPKSLRYIYLNGDEVQLEYGLDEETGDLNKQTLDRIIDALGILPNPRDEIKKLIFVEGQHDIAGLKKYSSLLNAHRPEIISLDNNPEIGFVISGGSSLKFYVDFKYLDGLGKPQVHIYDSDVPDYIAYVARINDENNPFKKGFNTSKKELENYLTKEAIEEAYLSNGLTIVLPEITDDMDVPVTVAKTIYESIPNNDWDSLDDKKKDKKVSAVKKTLNTQALDCMTIDRLVERDALEELTTWLNTIAGLN